MPPRFIARQLSNPSGLLGRVMGRLMNRHNARMNAFVVQRLELKPTDRVLEIGFGGGAALPALIDGAGFVAGVDRSRTMVQAARARFAAAVAAGRATFHEGTVEKLQFAEGSFGKVCAVNTVYFWPSLDAGFAEIRRVLSPGGRLVVGFLPKEWMDPMGFPADIFTSRTADDVVAALTRTAFTDVKIERPQPATRWNVVTARR